MEVLTVMYTSDFGFVFLIKDLVKSLMQKIEEVFHFVFLAVFDL